MLASAASMMPASSGWAKLTMQLRIGVALLGGVPGEGLHGLVDVREAMLGHEIVAEDDVRQAVGEPPVARLGLAGPLLGFSLLG